MVRLVRRNERKSTVRADDAAGAVGLLDKEEPVGELSGTRLGEDGFTDVLNRVKLPNATVTSQELRNLAETVILSSQDPGQTG